MLVSGTLLSALVQKLSHHELSDKSLFFCHCVSYKKCRQTICRHPWFSGLWPPALSGSGARASRGRRARGPRGRGAACTARRSSGPVCCPQGTGGVLQGGRCKLARRFQRRAKRCWRRALAKLERHDAPTCRAAPALRVLDRLRDLGGPVDVVDADDDLPSPLQAPLLPVGVRVGLSGGS